MMSREGLPVPKESLSKRPIFSIEIRAKGKREQPREYWVRLKEKMPPLALISEVLEEAGAASECGEE